MAQRIRHFDGMEGSERQLAFIDDLHALGLNTTIELPELVVVGDQNTGKSSVLQAITGISFPVMDGTCTRFPIQISFRQAPGPPKVRARIVPGRLSEDDAALRERIRDFNIERTEITPEAMDQIIQEATERVFGQSESQLNASKSLGKPYLSDATLRIERSGPDEVHWTIVDLPGLKRNSPDKSNAAIAERLVQSYLENERTITLVVVDNVDVERHRSLELVQKTPGVQSRCIGVLTKCDQKQEDSDRWMPSLLRNELSTVPNLDHGWFGVRNRVPKEAKVTDTERDEKEEMEFSKPAWESVPGYRKGIKALMSYVDRERRTQLHRQIPQIITEIRGKHRTCEANLQRLGEPRNTSQAQRYYVLQFCNEMQKMTEAIFRGQYQDVSPKSSRIELRYRLKIRLEKFFAEIINVDNMELPTTDYLRDLEGLSQHSSDPRQWEVMASMTGIYAEIYREARKRQAQNLAGSVHPDVEGIIFRKLSKHWEPAARRLMDDVKALVNECNDIILQVAIPNSKTRFEASRMVAKSLEEWDTDADNALSELIADNQSRPIWTLDPRLLIESMKAEQLRSKILLSARNTAPPPDQMPDSRINGEVRASGEVGDNEFPFLSTELSQVLHVAARVQIYYDIALYRFIDNVAMQVVERHLLGPKCPMRAISLDHFGKLSDKELEVVAGEDEADSLTRARLERERSRYKQALEKWESLRVL